MEVTGNNINLKVRDGVGYSMDSITPTLHDDVNVFFPYNSIIVIHCSIKILMIRVNVGVSWHAVPHPLHLWGRIESPLILLINNIFEFLIALDTLDFLTVEWLGFR